MIRHLAPMTPTTALDAEIRGLLQLEGDCLYVWLEEVDARYPIVWPADTRWDSEHRVVITPNGGRLEIGDEVYGGGGYFHADALDDLVGTEGADLGGACVDNTYGEFAVVNNDASAIGPRR